MRVRPVHLSTLHRRLICFALLALTIPIGIAWRFAPLHLPQFAWKYGGSALWAIGLYWLIAGLLPRAQPLILGLSASVLAVSVELFKLLRDPVIDRFRHTLAGRLLIGRYFTFGAIVAYVFAIAAIACLDSRLRPGRSA